MHDGKIGSGLPLAYIFLELLNPFGTLLLDLALFALHA